MTEPSCDDRARDRWGPPGVSLPIAIAIWIAFMLIPIVDALTRRGQPVLGHWLVVAGATVFSTSYLVWGLNWHERADRRWAALGLVTVQVPIAIALTWADQNSWGYLFCYSAACLAVSMPARLSFTSVLVTAAVCLGATTLGGGSGATGLSLALSVAGVGLLMVMLRNLRDRNTELREARAELAQVAVAAERERFARDLHDLLGHSLSVIAIKAELAGRFLPGSPERAAVEVGDVEGVARQALKEVRQAVSGYRRPTLAGELEGARVALSAAGIDASIDGEPVSLDPEVEAVLAWTVREGATNVIRHSGAQHCTLTVRAGAGDAGVEVLDDGATAGPGADGNGLAGLRERAAGLRGRIEAGAAPGGGFRLAVSVPVAAGLGAAGSVAGSGAGPVVGSGAGEGR